MASLLCLLLAQALAAAAQQDDAKALRYNFTSNPLANKDTVVSGNATDGAYRFTILTDRLFRYEWSEDGGFENRASTFAPWRYFDAPEFQVTDGDDSLEIVTTGFHIRYNKANFSSDGFTVDVDGDTWHYDGKDYGDLGGTVRTLDTIDGRIDLNPGVLSREKPFAVVDDSKSFLFDDDGWIAIREDGRADGYFFAHGRSYKDAIKDYFLLSGDQPLLPRFVLGNWWSRYHAYTDDEYLGLMDRFTAEKIPLTVGIVDMDWHLVDLPEEWDLDGWTGYTWNEDLFPDPKAFIDELHKRGLKTALNDHPAEGVRWYEEPYEDVARAVGIDPATKDPVEFDATSRAFLDAFFEELMPRFDEQGIDFWWIDWQQGTESKLPGVDPLWVLNHYHFLASRRLTSKIQVPLTFSRFGGPGSQRYPVGFSGDTVVSWASLDFQPEFTATASNIGYGWWSHDIGGHTGGYRDNELMARWVQLGCFSPVLRLHSTSGAWGSKEPWLWSPEAFDAIRDAMVLRHRLIPFLYTMNVRAHFEREPLVQPLYWAYPDVDEAYKHANEFFFGPDLLVAPITSSTSTTTLMAASEAWLPEDDTLYVDVLHPGLVYDGGQNVKLHRTLGETPVLAPEGTIFVLDATEIDGKHGLASPEHIQVQLVVGADASFELVEEDPDKEISVPPSTEDFIRTPITWEQSSGTLTIGPVSGSAASLADRSWSVAVLGVTKLGEGAEADFVNANRTRTVVVDIGTLGGSDSISVNLGTDLELEPTNMPQELYDVLLRSQMVYGEKNDVWNLVAASDDPIEEREAKLDDMGGSVDDALKSAVKEVWFADSRSIKGGYQGYPEHRSASGADFVVQE